ncbi:MAG: hypothetical protein B7Y08_12100 [Rhodospirillales bacterium 24-66-33]|nr:MAG: hypothetical protein B7Y57_09215 [Rhodospirillales bacterium 35-66-84]OYZ94606.1 MAG: hypothetical protein B7Y08_12100 [Rhodospirillales bacterium 24-66-33]OZB25498.1 MAG: hypothetical protein B7X63_11495 [Rhodospirillales bacterium 39-66-50]
MTTPSLYCRLRRQGVRQPPTYLQRRSNDNLFDKPGNGLLSPGDFVRHPGQPDWGLGQIQSMIGHRITVNFENAGKVVIDGNVIELAPDDASPR